MKTLFQVIFIIFISTPLSAQKKLIGEWKISSQKQLNLNKDQSFHLTKGTYNYTGTWTFDKKKKSSDILTLFFSSGAKKYFVEEIKKHELRLYDPEKDQVMILSRIEKEEVKEIVDAKEVKSTDNDPYAGMSKEEIIKKLYPRDYFDKGRFVFNPGYGLIDYLDSLPSALMNQVPSVSLLLESSIGHRFGLGAKLGYRSWTIPESTYKASLYSTALRMTYHPKTVDKLDAYFGGTALLRYGTLSTGNETTGKWSTDYSPVVGARYYLLSRFALTGEFAYDTSSNVTLGFALLFN